MRAKDRLEESGTVYGAVWFVEKMSARRGEEQIGEWAQGFTCGVSILDCLRFTQPKAVLGHIDANRAPRMPLSSGGSTTTLAWQDSMPPGGGFTPLDRQNYFVAAGYDRV